MKYVTRMLLISAAGFMSYGWFHDRPLLLVLTSLVLFTAIFAATTDETGE